MKALPLSRLRFAEHVRPNDVIGWPQGPGEPLGLDVIVTEHGVAHLRGCSLRERGRRLVAIAHPHREALERALHEGQRAA